MKPQVTLSVTGIDCCAQQRGMHEVEVRLIVFLTVLRADTLLILLVPLR